MRSFNLRQVKLRPGEEHREEIELELEPFELGGERYLPVPGTLPAVLAITKATTGLVFELRFTARLHGPCYRCLGDAVLEVPVDAARVPGGIESRGRRGAADALPGRRQPRSRAWARDAIALELPDKILCRPDCAGLCPVCGKNLNDEPHEHQEETGDSRWSALESLREQL